MVNVCGSSVRNFLPGSAHRCEVTPEGLGFTETGTAAVLVGWGADPAQATAGVVLFSIFTQPMEVPLGALGWVAWSLSPKLQPVAEGTSGRR